MSDNNEYKMLRLENDNYVLWKWQIMNVFNVKGLNEVFQPLKVGETLNETKDKQALALLGSSLSPSEMYKIIDCKNFKDAWNTIERNHENKTAYEPQNLFMKLNSFKINSASEVSQGISEIKNIVAQLKNLEQTVCDANVIGAILNALPSSFDYFSAIWRNTSNQKLDDLIAKLMAEASVITTKELNETKALAVKSNTSKRGERKGNKNTRNEQDKNKCRYCKEEGHWIKDCPNLKTPYNPNYRKKKNKKDEDKKPDEKQFDFACMTRNNSEKFDDETWIADSGCTHHMSPYKHLFSSFTTSSSTNEIRLADENLSLKVEGQGEILTKQCRLKNVLYVPGLTQNLFSISAATRNGWTLTGSKEKLSFSYKNTTVFEANIKEKLYLITLEPKNPIEAYVKSATIKEWHARFNHVSPDTINLMMKNNAVDGLQIAKQSDDKCEDCQLNKCTKVSHKLRSTRKATEAGNVLHVDTSGKTNTVSRGGSQYLVLCKDEASKYRQVAFVATKNEIPDKVKEFINRAKLETGNEVLKLVTDNGTEFVNQNLQKFLKDRGILHDCSSPYVPQQNGFIERDMRTLKEMARTMLNNSKLDKNLWAEAVSCAVYTLNRVLNNSNINQTPYELWHKVKPNVNNLRIFGELAILKKQNQTKNWDEIGSKGIFVGYTDKFNTYKFIYKSKIIIACDVVFLNKMYDDSQLIENQRKEDYWISAGSSSIIIDEMNTECTPNNQTTGSESNSQYFMPEPTPRSSTPRNQMQNPNDEGIYFNELASMEASDQPIEQVQQNPSGIQQLIQLDQPVNVGGPTISPFFETNNDLSFTINQGQITDHFKLSDLEYRTNANNWINKRTGHFIRKDFINDIKRQIRNLGNQGRANVVHTTPKKEIPIPDNFNEAIESTHHQGWKNAMDDEMNSLIKNQVFEVVPKHSVKKKVVSSRWVFVVKYKQNGEVEKFKARVVARGFSQIYGIDYTETYCSVVQIMTTRLIIAYAAKTQLKIKQFDVKTAFLYGELHEEIYMQPPDGYAKSNELWRLKRSLYGLKQSPRMWNEKFAEFMESINFSMSNYDNSVFYNWSPLVIIIVYVDDGLIFARKESDINHILKLLQERFEIRELEVTIYRGLEIEIRDDSIFVHQTGYANKILQKFNMAQSKETGNPFIEIKESNEPLRPEVPYRQAIGSLMYLADVSRPDISFTVNQLARKVSNPTEANWKQVKHLLRYIKGSSNLGIEYRRAATNGYENLIGYSDSDFAGDENSSKSTTGFVILFNGSPFHWKTQLQRHITLSSTESEVIALCSLSKELSWINRMSVELRLVKSEAAIIKCDNQSALRIVQSVKMTARTRHLRAQDAYIREQIQSDELKLEHVSSEVQLADMLTKGLKTAKLTSNRNSLMKLSSTEASRKTNTSINKMRKL